MKFYLPLFILSFLAFSWTYARAETVSLPRESCADNFRTSEELFLQATQKIPPWKRKILSKLWQKQIEDGTITLKSYARVYDIWGHHLKVVPTKHPQKDYLYEKLLPYALTLPHQIIQSMVVTAAIPELSAAEKLLFIPAKVIITSGLTDTTNHIIFLLGLGATGYFLYQIGLSDQNLIDMIHLDKLANDEIILLIKMDPTEARQSDKNISALLTGDLADTMAKDYPHQFKVLDADQMKSFDFSFPHFLGEEKKVKQVIITSHGEPGQIRSEYLNRDFTLLELATYLELRSLPSVLSKKDLEINFVACAVAYNDYGKNQVILFAQTIIPGQGKVLANIFLDYAADQFNSIRANDLTVTESLSHYASSTLPLISPTIGLITDATITLTTRLLTPALFKQKNDGPSIFQPTIFEVELDKSKSN